MIFTDLYPFFTFQVEEQTDTHVETGWGANKNLFVWSPILSIM